MKPHVCAVLLAACLLTAAPPASAAFDPDNPSALTSADTSRPIHVAGNVIPR